MHTYSSSGFGGLVARAVNADKTNRQMQASGNFVLLLIVCMGVSGRSDLRRRCRGACMVAEQALEGSAPSLPRTGTDGAVSSTFCAVFDTGTAQRAVATECSMPIWFRGNAEGQRPATSQPRRRPG